MIRQVEIFEQVDSLLFCFSYKVSGKVSGICYVGTLIIVGAGERKAEKVKRLILP